MSAGEPCRRIVVGWVRVTLAGLSFGPVPSLAQEHGGSMWMAQNSEGGRPDQRPGSKDTGPMSGPGSFRTAAISFHA